MKLKYGGHTYNSSHTTHGGLSTSMSLFYYSCSKASASRRGRNPTLLMRRRCVPKFTYFSCDNTPSRKLNPTPAKFYWNIPGAYGDSADFPPDADDGDLEDAEIEIQIEETGKNRRTIQSRVSMEASLQTVWNILTDYEKLADFLPGLVASQLLQRTDNFARLLQVGQQNLAFGLKFKAKGVIDCYEKDIQNIPFGQRRDIEFRMIEGDFQLFRGKWSVEQIGKGEHKYRTTLSYVVDVEPKVWLPVGLVQGRICQEIKRNLLCIKIAAERPIQNKVSACE